MTVRTRHKHKCVCNEPAWNTNACSPENALQSRSLQPLSTAPGRLVRVHLSTDPAGGSWAMPSSCPVAVTCKPPGHSAFLKDRTFFLPVCLGTVLSDLKILAEKSWCCWGLTLASAPSVSVFGTTQGHAAAVLGQPLASGEQAALAWGVRRHVDARV